MFLKGGEMVEGHYRVGRALGGGGYATVYLATDQRLNIEVALKVLRISGTTPEAHAKLLARFEGEAQIAARVRHRCSVEVTNYGTLPTGQPFLIMEYIDGPTLAEALEAGGAMGAERVKALWLDTLQALAEAHGMGVVHRDLKPDNLILADAGTRRERLVILDFGIARRVHDADRRHSTTRGYLGTPSYMPPELLVDASKATTATDVFQVGLIMAEMLTGASCIQADSIFAVAEAYRDEGWGVPEALAGSPFGPLLDCALRLDPAERFPDAQALMGALGAVDLTLERAPTPRDEDDAVVPRGQVPAAWALAGVLVLCVGVVWAFMSRRDEDEGDALRRDEATQAAREEEPAGEQAKGARLTEEEAVQGEDGGGASAGSAPSDEGEAEPSPAEPSGMVFVEAGAFVRGADGGPDDAKPQEGVWLDGYWMDAHEVTVGEYAACVAAGVCTVPTKRGRGYDNWGASGPREERLRHPINGVDWDQAAAFCRWKGKRLPSEAEWEKAARGTDGRTYPWGEAEVSCRYAVIDDGGWGCGETRTWEVGSKPEGVSPYGAHDMAGNVWEWTADWYDADYYASPAGKGRNPTGPSSGKRRVVRGGSWYYVAGFAGASFRYRFAPIGAFSHVGFRCARSS